MADQNGHEAHAGHGHGELGHVTPISQLVAVFACLLILTALTVAVSKNLNLGWLSLFVALVVATAKGTLVCLYFMHLRYDRPFNALAFCAGFLFLSLFLFFALTDSTQYQPDIQHWESDNPMAAS